MGNTYSSGTNQGRAITFDQAELRGGESWDAKIKKQIRDCALFVPVISRNTEARLEGYFRLERKLAEDRSHLMAKGKPFIVPVTHSRSSAVTVGYLKPCGRKMSTELSTFVSISIAAIFTVAATPVPGVVSTPSWTT